MMRLRNYSILGFAIAAALAGLAFAGSAAAGEITVYPNSPDIQGGAVVPVANDHAPGQGTGAFQANGSTATQIYFTSAQLFGTGNTVTVGDLDSLSFWTKFVTPPGATAVDWYINIYTAPNGDGTGQNDASWYQRRLTLEPYFSQNLNAPTGDWVQWTTSGDSSQTDKLRIYDSFRGVGGSHVFGTYTDPFLSAVTGGPINWSDYNSAYQNATYDYTTDPIEFIALSTGSAWANGFNGMLDGFSVTWNTGSTDVDFEATQAAVPEPQQDMWLFGGGLAFLGLGLFVQRRRRAVGDTA